MNKQWKIPFYGLFLAEAEAEEISKHGGKMDDFYSVFTVPKDKWMKNLWIIMKYTLSRFFTWHFRNRSARGYRGSILHWIDNAGSVHIA